MRFSVRVICAQAAPAVLVREDNAPESKFMASLLSQNHHSPGAIVITMDGRFLPTVPAGESDIGQEVAHIGGSEAELAQLAAFKLFQLASLSVDLTAKIFDAGALVACAQFLFRRRPGAFPPWSWIACEALMIRMLQWLPRAQAVVRVTLLGAGFDVQSLSSAVESPDPEACTFAMRLLAALAYDPESNAIIVTRVLRSPPIMRLLVSRLQDMDPRSPAPTIPIAASYLCGVIATYGTPEARSIILAGGAVPILRAALADGGLIACRRAAAAYALEGLVTGDDAAADALFSPEGLAGCDALLAVAEPYTVSPIQRAIRKGLASPKHEGAVQAFVTSHAGLLLLG